MKQIFLRMQPDIASTFQKVIGIGYANEPDKLKDGSGFCIARQVPDDGDLFEYWIGCDEAIYDAAIADMLAQGLTITFPPPKMIPLVDENGNTVYEEVQEEYLDEFGETAYRTVYHQVMVEEVPE